MTGRPEGVGVWLTGVTAAVPAALPGPRTPEARRAKAGEVTNDVAEAEALIRRMDLEARSLPQDQKAPLLKKLRGYKQDLSRLKDDLKKVRWVERRTPHGTGNARGRR